MEETEWLKDCLVRILKDKVHWSEYGMTIQEEVEGKVRVYFVGGEMVLIQSKIDVEIQSHMELLGVGRRNGSKLFMNGVKI